jgi:hypothetical protein
MDGYRTHWQMPLRKGYGLKKVPVSGLKRVQMYGTVPLPFWNGCGVTLRGQAKREIRQKPVAGRPAIPQPPLV